jgi:hypothetical protein
MDQYVHTWERKILETAEDYGITMLEAGDVFGEAPEILKPKASVI